MTTAKCDRTAPPRCGEGPAAMSRRGLTLILCGILAVSLVIHAIHFAALLKSGLYRLPVVFVQSDMHAFLEWSDAILSGDILQGDTYHPCFEWMPSIAPMETWYRWWGGKTIFQQEPLYVYALSLVRWVSGGALWVPPLVQLLIGSLQPLVIFLLARRLFEERAALVAAALAAVYGPFVFYQGVLLRDWLPPLMEPIALILLLRADQRAGTIDSLAAGIWLALCALGKSLILLFLPFALIWLASRRGTDKNRWWRRPALALVGFAAGLSPLVVRNAMVGSPVLAFHNRTAEGFIQANAVDAQPVGLSHPHSMQTILQKTDGRLSAVIAETLHGFEGRWSDFFRLQLLKLRGNLEPIDIPNNVSICHDRELSPVLWLTLGFGPVAAAGLAGLLMAIRRRGPHGLVLIYIATQVAALISATVLGRYRLALAAVLMVYAGAALVGLWDAIRRRQVRSAALRLGLLAAATAVEYVLVPIPSLRTTPDYEYYPAEYVICTTMYVSEHRFEQAVDETRRLGAWARRFPNAATLAAALQRDVQHLWARTLLEQGDNSGALEHARLAARIDVAAPNLDHVHFQLGELFYQLSSPADAAAQLRLYLQKQPQGQFAEKARDLLKQIGQP